MKRAMRLSTFAIVALLLPGLALAAPIAGPCGRCDQGTLCPGMETAPQAPPAHSCCSEAASETSTAPSLGSSNCDCSRETPPAVVANPAPTVKTGTADVPRAELVAPASPTRAATVRFTSAPAPPPAAPFFLIDCAYLI